MPVLTPAEMFCAKRVKDKIGAMMHHLGDAIRAASALTPEVHAASGFPRAVEVLEQRIAELRAIVSNGLPPAQEKPEGGTNG